MVLLVSGVFMTNSTHGSWFDQILAGGKSNAAGSAAALSVDEMTRGLKEALAQGTEKAIKSLGTTNGFLGNPTVKIPVPQQLRDIEKGLRTMLIGALGCNIAWGIIDGILYLMGCLAETGKRLRAWRAFKKAQDPVSAHRVIGDLLPSMMAELLTVAEYEPMRLKLQGLPEPPTRPRLDKNEWLGAVGVFLWVFVTTFPVAILFLFLHDVHRAMRASNAIAIAMLFVTGYAFGRCA
jgi:hypothetical protein